MKENKEKFKQFVIEQLKDYDEWREASPDGYAEIITDEAVKLFCHEMYFHHSQDMLAFLFQYLDIVYKIHHFYFFVFAVNAFYKTCKL